MKSNNIKQEGAVNSTLISNAAISQKIHQLISFIINIISAADSQ